MANVSSDAHDREWIIRTYPKAKNYRFKENEWRDIAGCSGARKWMRPHLEWQIENYGILKGNTGRRKRPSETNKTLLELAKAATVFSASLKKTLSDGDALEAISTTTALSANQLSDLLAQTEDFALKTKGANAVLNPSRSKTDHVYYFVMMLVQTWKAITGRPFSTTKSGRRNKDAVDAMLFVARMAKCADPTLGPDTLHKTSRAFVRAEQKKVA